MDVSNNIGYLFPVEYQQNLAASESEKLTLKMEIEKLFERLKQHEANTNATELGTQLRDQIEINIKLCQDKDFLLEEIVYLKRELSRAHEANLEMQKRVDEANAETLRIQKERELDDAVILQQENDRLRERLSDLQSESRLNMQKIIGLENKLRHCNADSSPNSPLKRLMELEKQHELLQHECDCLQHQNKALEVQNRALERENAALRDTYNSISESIIADDKKELGTEGKKLKDQIGELNDKVNELNNIIDQQHEDMEHMMRNLDRSGMGLCEGFLTADIEREYTERQQKLCGAMDAFATSVGAKLAEMEATVQRNRGNTLNQMGRLLDAIWKVTDTQAAPSVMHAGGAELGQIVEQALERLHNCYSGSLQSVQITSLRPEVVGLVKGFRREFRMIANRLHTEHCELMKNFEK